MAEAAFVSILTNIFAVQPSLPRQFQPWTSSPQVHIAHIQLLLPSYLTGFHLSDINKIFLLTVSYFSIFFLKILSIGDIHYIHFRRTT